MSTIKYDPEICNFKNEKKQCPCCKMRAASEEAQHNCRANPLYQGLSPRLEKIELPETDNGCSHCERIKQMKERLASKRAELDKRQGI